MDIVLEKKLDHRAQEETRSQNLTTDNTDEHRFH